MEAGEDSRAGLVAASEFDRAYSAQLAALEARQVVEDLASMFVVLLCWEAPGQYCHRRLVAGWLESELGIVVPELIC